MNPMSQSSGCKCCGGKGGPRKVFGSLGVLRRTRQLQGRVEVLLVFSAWGRAGGRPGAGSMLIAAAVGSARRRRENGLSGWEFQKVTCEESVKPPVTPLKKTGSRDTCYSSRVGCHASEMML